MMCDIALHKFGNIVESIKHSEITAITPSLSAPSQESAKCLLGQRYLS